MKNRILLFIVFLITFSCIEEKKNVSNNSNTYISSKTKNIEGNWYYIYREIDERIVDKDRLIVYNEVYISKDTIFQYTQIAGLLSPQKYIIENDSLFLNEKKESNYAGKIESVKSNEIVFSMNEYKDFSYFKIYDNITLEDLVKNKVIEKEYKKNYYKRAGKAKLEYR